MINFIIKKIVGSQNERQVRNCLLYTSNQTWTSNNSPYIVVGDINVAGLTILPGVTVQFASNYAFEVDGTLQALGAVGLPIVFTGTNGGWQGLYFNCLLYTSG